MHEPDLNLLNIYELPKPDGPLFLVAFLEPVLAELRGIASRAVVGEFTPQADGEFDPSTFRLNPEFIAAFVAYMNEEAIRSPELLSQAAANPSSQLHLFDPRGLSADEAPPDADLLGHFTIDPSGVPVPGSFHYNPRHLMFDPVRGESEILTDRQFYNWLHAVAEPPRDGPSSDLPIVP